MNENRIHKEEQKMTAKKRTLAIFEDLEVPVEVKQDNQVEVKEPKPRTISRAWDAKIYCNATQLVKFNEFLRISDLKTRVSSKFLFNIYYGHHFLSGIIDVSSIPDIDKRIKKVFFDAVNEPDGGQKFTKKSKVLTASMLRDILNAFNPKRKRQPDKEDYSLDSVLEAYKLKEAGCSFCLADYVPEFTDSTTKENIYYDMGLGHTLSYISNCKNYSQKNAEWKQKVSVFKEKNVEYMKLRSMILETERRCQEKFEFNNFALTCGWCKNKNVQEIMQDVGLAVTDELVEIHSKYKHDKIGIPPRKPRFNAKCGVVFLKDDSYSIAGWIDNGTNNAIKAKISIKEMSLPSESLSVRIRPGIAMTDLKGLSFYKAKIDAHGRHVVYCRFRAKTEHDKPIKGDDFLSTAFVDLGWYRQTTILFRNEVYRFDLMNEKNEVLKKYEEAYDELRKNKKSRGRLPKMLKEKRRRISVHKNNELPNKLIVFLKSIGASAVCLEEIGYKQKVFRNPKGGRKQETRRNYMISAIASETFKEKLELSGKKHSMRIVWFRFMPNKSEDAGYRPSQTCDKCNSLGKRFNIIDGCFKEHIFGKIFCCPNGHIRDSDVMACRNLSRSFHKRKLKKLPLFKFKEKVSDVSRGEIIRRMSEKWLPWEERNRIIEADSGHEEMADDRMHRILST